MTFALSYLHRRWLLVVTIGAVAAAAAAGYSLAAAKRYEATATLVVAPVPPGDPTLLGIDVLHDTQRRTAAETAARLIAAPEIAEAVRVRLGLRTSRAQVLHDIKTGVVRDSSAVTVTGTADSATRAAQLANAFVDAFVSARTAGFQSEVASAVRRLRTQILALPPNRRLSPEGVQLQRRLADLQALVGTSDPTVRHGSEAAAPSSASWPHPLSWTLWGALIGLGAGALLALGLGTRGRARGVEAVAGPGYDPNVSERIVARLEERLAKRVEELAAEQQRLAAREASLAVREREAAAAVQELREAVPSPAAEPSRDPTADPASQEKLAQREAALERRERELADALARSGSKTREASEELEQREQTLAGRVAALEEREQALARSSAELHRLETKIREAEASAALRAADLHARESELSVSDEDPSPLPAPRPPVAPPAQQPFVPQQPPPAAPEADVRLGQLERLVQENADAFPDRVEEWTSYLFYLRDYADTEGRIPAQFGWLIDDAFGDLIALAGR